MAIVSESVMAYCYPLIPALLFMVFSAVSLSFYIKDQKYD